MPPKPRTFQDMLRRQWKEGEAKTKSRPAAIKVIEDVYGRVVPLASDPIVDEDAKPYVVSMPDAIPESWQPSPDTAEQYQQAMQKYQTEIIRRRQRDADPIGKIEADAEGKDEKDPAQIKLAQLRKNAARGFGRSRGRGRRGRGTRRVKPY